MTFPVNIVKMPQMPTIASNVIHASLGHLLPQSVTIGTWPTNATADDIDREQGPGGFRRQTAWEFMGQQTHENYARLVFEGRSAEAEEPSTSATTSRWNRHTSQASASGYSAAVEMPEVEEVPVSSPPQVDRSSAEEVSTTAQPDATTGRSSPKEVPEADDEIMEEVQMPRLDAILEDAATSALAASNPWVLYDAGLVCAQNADGEFVGNFQGGKCIQLIEWISLSKNQSQRTSLRHQSFSRVEWEALPWTGHQCYLLCRAWELGRMKSYYLHLGTPYGMDKATEFLDKAGEKVLTGLEFEAHQLAMKIVLTLTKRKANGQGHGVNTPGINRSRLTLNGFLKQFLLCTELI